MCGISVEVIDCAPAVFEVEVESRTGERHRLPADHEDTLEIEELAYGRLLSDAVRSLPAGTIRVRMRQDERGDRPANRVVAARVVAAVRDHEGGWSTWR